MTERLKKKGSDQSKDREREASIERLREGGSIEASREIEEARVQLKD